MNDRAAEVMSELSERVEGLDRKIREMEFAVGEAEKEAYERGLRAGLAANGLELQDKTIIIKVPDSEVEMVSRIAGKVMKEFNARCVICTNEMEIADLHQVELKALGLKRISDGNS